MKKPIIIIPTYNPTHSLIRIVRALSGANQTIIIVNDGSDQPSCASIFETLSHMRNVTLLTHLVNSGKGKALKSGLIYFKDNFPNSPGVITADADGQHDFEDIAKLLKQFKKQNQYLILGSRKFDRYVPLRSRLGNLLTRKIFKFFIER